MHIYSYNVYIVKMIALKLKIKIITKTGIKGTHFKGRFYGSWLILYVAGMNYLN